MPPRICHRHAVETATNIPGCLRTPSIRYLSITLRSSLAVTPPESPKFIDVPLSLQPDAIKYRQIKGTLPVPRKIFPHVPSPTDIDKTSPTYLYAVTPPPQPKGPPPPFTDPTIAAFISWKARQAEARRKNLREGLIELSIRKKTSDKIRNKRSARRSAERERLVHMPMREDERLTGPTILQSQLPARLRRNGKPAPIPDPDREARVRAARQNTARHEMERSEERRDQLHTLYMNANTFITTEAQLNAVVERVFNDTEQFKSEKNPGENVWNLGYQTTVAQMLDDVNEGKKATDAGRKAMLVKERYKQIAEVLTGGKM